MYWWCTGDILVRYWWYIRDCGILVVYWWHTGDILVTYWWYTYYIDDILVISKFSKTFSKVEPHMDRRCTGDILVIYWWYAGDIKLPLSTPRTSPLLNNAISWWFLSFQNCSRRSSHIWTGFASLPAKGLSRYCRHVRTSVKPCLSLRGNLLAALQ